MQRRVLQPVRDYLGQLDANLIPLYTNLGRLTPSIQPEVVCLSERIMAMNSRFYWLIVILILGSIAMGACTAPPAPAATLPPKPTATAPAVTPTIKPTVTGPGGFPI